MGRWYINKFGAENDGHKTKVGVVLSDLAELGDVSVGKLLVCAKEPDSVREGVVAVWHEAGEVFSKNSTGEKKNLSVAAAKVVAPEPVKVHVEPAQAAEEPVVVEPEKKQAKSTSKKEKKVSK